MADNSDKDYSDLRAEHLQMIQGLITCNARCSRGMKQWSIIVIVAGVGLYLAIDAGFILGVAAAIIALFSTADASNLQQKTGYSDLFAKIQSEPKHQRPDFRLVPDVEVVDITSFYDGFKSRATWPLYSALMVILAVVWVLN